MQINGHRCFLLSLPEPKSYESETSYVLRLLLEGLTLNTRQARFIGIGNLHSTASTLINKRRVDITKTYRRVIKPGLVVIPPKPVLVVSMTPEQIESYKAKRHPEGCRFALLKTS